MAIIEKIYLTWLLLVLPVSFSAWFFSDILDENSAFYKIMTAFVALPLFVGFVTWLIWGIVQIWQV